MQRRSDPLDDERRHLDRRENVPDIGLPNSSLNRTSHCRSRTEVSRSVPPISKIGIICDRRRVYGEQVKTELHGIRVRRQIDYRIHEVSSDPEGIIRCPGSACRGAEQDQSTDPIGLRRGEDDPVRSRGERSDYRGLGRTDGVQNGDRVPGPFLVRRGRPRGPTVRLPDSPLVERMSRPIDASRRWNRAIRGSSSTQSIGVVPPVSIRMSVGPSPSTWKALSMPSTWVYLVRGLAATARE